MYRINYISQNVMPSTSCTSKFLSVIKLTGICFQALAGVAQWTEHHPANQKVAGLIPGQGTCLGCGPGPQLGACESQLIDISLPIHVSLHLFLPPFPLSKNKEIKSFLKIWFHVSLPVSVQIHNFAQFSSNFIKSPSDLPR